jgi:hypothetical protein
MSNDFISKRISDVVCIDATVAERYDFLATHLPFKNLRFATSGVLTQQTVLIGEEQLFKTEIMERRERHNFIIVKGDNGCGKSHFIRWVKEKYINQVDSSQEVVIFIARSQNTLRGALEQIIESNVFSENFKADEIKLLLNAQEHLNENELKLNILHQFAIACVQDNNEDDNSILDRRYRSKVRDYLMDRCIEQLLFKKGGPIERIVSRLTSEGSNDEKVNFEEPRFYPEDFLMSISMKQKLIGESSKQARRLAEDLNSDDDKGPIIRDKLAQYLNSKLEVVVQSTTNLRSTDLKRIFEKLRIELKNQGKNLTLFIEDITVLTGLDRALVEVLVTENRGTEHNQKFCRLFSLIGITSSYYSTSIPDNLRDRVTGRIELDNAILINSKETSEMAARYINAINLKPEILEEWMIKDGADSERLPISSQNVEYNWANVKLPDNKIMSIFPFNEASLWTMYQGIPEKDRTPREFLKRVILNIFKLYASNPEDFPPSPTILSGFFKIPQWRNTIHEQKVENDGGKNSNRLKSLLLLWGDASILVDEDNGVRKVGSLSKEVFHSFNLPFISGTIDSNKVEHNQTPKTETIIQVPLSHEKAIIQKKETKEEKDFKEIQEEIDNWAQGSKLRNYQKLRDDVCDVLTDYIDWKSYGIPASFVQDFFKRPMISIEGQIGLVKKSGFQVKRETQSKYALLALSSWRYLGNGSWNFVGAEDHLLNLQTWMINVKDEAIASVISPKDVQGVDISQIPKLALLVEYYVQAFAGNLNQSTKSTTDIYNKIFRRYSPITIEEGRSKGYRDIQYKLLKKENDLRNHHDMIMQYYNCLQGDISRSDIFFENVSPIIELIDELKKMDWNIDEIDIIDIDAKDDNICFRSLKLINIIKDYVSNAIQGEKDRSREIIEKLNIYTDGDYSQENIISLFKNINNFLLITLKEMNDMNYKTEDFEFILSGSGTAKKFENAYKILLSAVNSTSRSEQLIMYSMNPNVALEPYITSFDNFSKLLENTLKKYQNKIDGLSDQAQNVEKVILETTNLLIELRNNLNKMSNGDGEND